MARSWACETYSAAVTAFIKNPFVTPRSSQSSPPEHIVSAVTRGHRRSTRGQHATIPAGMHGFRSFFLYGEVLKLPSCYMKSRKTPPSLRRQKQMPHRTRDEKVPQDIQYIAAKLYRYIPPRRGKVQQDQRRYGSPAGQPPAEGRGRTDTATLVEPLENF